MDLDKFSDVITALLVAGSVASVAVLLYILVSWV